MKKNVLVIMIIFITCLYNCKPKEQEEQGKPVSILVFVTGVLAESPTYELLAAGAEEFASENENITVKIYEAGFNQAEWEEQLQSMVATGSFDLVIGSNPSLPQLCANVCKFFPSQKFIITDAQYEGNPQICTYLYNQYEQSLFLGYLAGLVTTSNMPHANTSVQPPRIGFIAAQEFPLLTRQMVPGFIDGAHFADPSIELDFRVIGNWFDANKAADLAAGMISAGVDVFSSVAGGAEQGIIQTVKDRAASGMQSAYMVHYHTNVYDKAPGFIIGCGFLDQKKLVKEILAKFINDEIQYGVSNIIGVKDGYLDFIFDDSGYRDHLPPYIQEQFELFLQDLKEGRIEYLIPPL